MTEDATHSLDILRVRREMHFAGEMTKQMHIHNETCFPPDEPRYRGRKRDRGSSLSGWSREEPLVLDRA